MPFKHADNQAVKNALVFYITEVIKAEIPEQWKKLSYLETKIANHYRYRVNDSRETPEQKADAKLRGKLRERRNRVKEIQICCYELNSLIL